MVFDDVIADMAINKKISPIVTEQFIRRRKYLQYFYIIFLSI